MKSENKYIGDDKMQNMLEHYNCPTPLPVVKMKFAGAVSSPNLELRPADVISSFWEEDKQPRLATKKEADLFFKFFMGLWDEVFEKVKTNKIKLSPQILKKKEDIKHACQIRFFEIEFGFVEGFWGGKENIKMPAFVAEILDKMNDLANVYNTLADKLEKDADLEEVKQNFINTDKIVEKALSFIIENFVLPKIEDLTRTVN